MSSRAWTLMLSLTVVFGFLAGCAGLPIVSPTGHAFHRGNPVPAPPPEPGPIILWLALSGGGTRAAALAHGVMGRLEEISIPGTDGRPSNLLREVDYISSVSGGSFAAAFYVLNRHRPDWKELFTERVLKNNIEVAIGARLFVPPNLLSIVATNYSRTNIAANYYDRHIFEGKRFHDLPSKPALILNASDLVAGHRFEFSPRDFNCLAADWADYRVADAVAASSAFPGAFPSLIVGNYGPHNECPNRSSTPRAPGRCLSVQEELAEQFVREKHGDLGGPELDSLRNKIFFEAEKKRAYCNIEETRYIHLSDGGLTDNLGVDAFLARANDPSSEVYTAIFQGRTKAVVIIAVNAATAPPEDLGKKPEGAWFGKIILRGIDLMMERVAWDSLDATRNRIVEFERKVRRIQPDFRAYFIEITFDDIKDPERRRRLNKIGTWLALPEDQVEDLIAAGRELLDSGRNGDNGLDLRRIVAFFGSWGR